MKTWKYRYEDRVCEGSRVGGAKKRWRLSGRCIDFYQKPERFTVIRDADEQ